MMCILYQWVMVINEDEIWPALTRGLNIPFSSKGVRFLLLHQILFDICSEMASLMNSLISKITAMVPKINVKGKDKVVSKGKSSKPKVR